MSESHSVVLTGKVLEGYRIEGVAIALAQLLRTTEDEAKGLLSGRETVVKRNLTSVEVERYLQALSRTGAKARSECSQNKQIPASTMALIQTEPASAHEEVSPSTELSIVPVTDICPKCGRSQPRRTLCTECGCDMPRIRAAQEQMQVEVGKSILTRTTTDDIQFQLKAVQSVASTSWRSLVMIVRIFFGLLAVFFIFKIIQGSLFSRASALPQSMVLRAEEKLIIQAYYKKYGVRPASRAEVELLEQENRRKENEAREAAFEKQRADRDYRRFVDESRQMGQDAHAELVRDEERMRQEEMEKERNKQYKFEEQKRLDENRRLEWRRRLIGNSNED